MDEQARGERGGQVAVFTCPECGGALWQVDEAELIRFRCHVGHAYNGEVLLAEQDEALEAAMWTAVRTFREKSVLSHQLANRERRAGNTETALRLEEQAKQSDRYGALIRNVLLSEPSRDTGPAPTLGELEAGSSAGGSHERLPNP
jgi:two-component system chemotaxis response regulator CheB